MCKLFDLFGTSKNALKLFLVLLKEYVVCRICGLLMRRGHCLLVHRFDYAFHVF